VESGRIIGRQPAFDPAEVGTTCSAGKGRSALSRLACTVNTDWPELLRPV